MTLGNLRGILTRGVGAYLEHLADNPDPLHIATCDKIRETAHKHGIKCVMHCGGATFAAGAVKRGFDMVMVTSDASCMVAGARLLSQRIVVMKDGRVIETGLTDQVLDDPREPYTQLLVSSILPP